MTFDQIAAIAWVVALVGGIGGVTAWIASFARFQHDQDLHPGPYLVLAFAGATLFVVAFLAFLVALLFTILGAFA